ncbi:hypothetical protein Cabys_1263 [Caldithrix abyssi DSM 13497]|uniref:Uncharacterized protein n=1 Tax=Caldithrix abyssi DSM 13497 TaxID=880073 RepID=A0A1J1C6I3_CALAY|nr:hypothetical protein Cabys_1263 [Caldithrix abyssi DSM 13497]
MLALLLTRRFAHPPPGRLPLFVLPEIQPSGKKQWPDSI